MAYRKKTDERDKKKERLKKSTRDRDIGYRANKTLIIIFVILLSFVAVKGAISCFELKAQQKEVEQKYASLLSEKEELEETLKYINTPEYVEKTARDMLKMVMPGEILYVLKDEDTSRSSGKDENTGNPAP